MPKLSALSKKLPGGVSYSTPGTGSPQHLIGELLKQRTGANFVHIPYSGGGPATNDLLAGHTPMTIVTLPSILPHLDRVRILAIGDAQRMPSLPNVQTISETVPDVVVSGWSGYDTPIEGLFLAGAGSHPGGGISGAPGMDAARRVMEGRR